MTKWTVGPTAPAGALPRRWDTTLAICRLAVAGLAIVAIVVACAGGASPSLTVEPTGVIASPIVGVPSPSPGTSASAGGPSPSIGRTTTDWGEIWDGVPPSFPLPSGVVPAELGGGPVSGAYTTADPIRTIADRLAASLRTGGYSSVDVSGPLEDGSETIDATGADAACRVHVTVRRAGSLTAIEILYGAGCPFR